jgi:hypothetical protein
MHILLCFSDLIKWCINAQFFNTFQQMKLNIHYISCFNGRQFENQLKLQMAKHTWTERISVSAPNMRRFVSEVKWWYVMNCLVQVWCNRYWANIFFSDIWFHRFNWGRKKLCFHFWERAFHIATCRVVCITKRTGSSLDDWIY